MTLQEMTAEVETCRTKLSQIQDELIRLLDAPNIAVKSSLFGAATQCKSAVHMTSCLLESLEAYGQIVRHLSD
jgi:hypothetical protein